MKFFAALISLLLAAAVVLTACTRQPAAPETEPLRYDAAAQRQIAEDSLAFLQTHVLDRASFDQITEVFETLCAQPTADELILFEAGTFTADGEEWFTVSLARQIPNGEDEFYQIRAGLSFLPDAENRGIEETMWLDLTNGDDFSAVRESAAYAYAESHGAVGADFRIDET